MIDHETILNKLKQLETILIRVDKRLATVEGKVAIISAIVGAIAGAMASVIFGL